MTHPARYSPQIIDAFRTLLAGAPHVHDPFAGTGERLGALCDELGVTYSGTELEAPFIVDPRVWAGDSRQQRYYPITRNGYWIVTSPTYGNGMNDNFKPADASKRYTYRAALIEATGDRDAALTDGNTGAHGYRSGVKAAARYWELNAQVVAQWGHAERAIVNVSDFYKGDERVGIVAGWGDLLRANGWRLLELIPVETPRMRNGSNRGKRVEHESIIVAERRTT